MVEARKHNKGRKWTVRGKTLEGPRKQNPGQGFGGGNKNQSKGSKTCPWWWISSAERMMALGELVEVAVVLLGDLQEVSDPGVDGL